MKSKLTASQPAQVAGGNDHDQSILREMDRNDHDQSILREMDRNDHDQSILRDMDRNDFTLAVERAEAEAMNALEARDAMLRWARRLQPYLDRDPQMTVAEALQRYDSAQG